MSFGIESFAYAGRGPLPQGFIPPGLSAADREIRFLQTGKWVRFPLPRPVAARRTFHIMSPISSAEIDGGRSRSPKSTDEFSGSGVCRRPAGIFFLLVPILALGAFLSWQTFRVGRAVFADGRYFHPPVRKGFAAGSGNADLLHHLGTLYSTDPTEANPTEAVKNLRQAVARNPRRWDYWMDLGIACDFASDIACSDHAFEQSAAINPKTPAVMWAVGKSLPSHRPARQGLSRIPPPHCPRPAILDSGFSHAVPRHARSAGNLRRDCRQFPRSLHPVLFAPLFMFDGRLRKRHEALGGDDFRPRSASPNFLW